jgi:hypothetical protein
MPFPCRSDDLQCEALLLGEQIHDIVQRTVSAVDVVVASLGLSRSAARLDLMETTMPGRQEVFQCYCHFVFLVSKIM